MENEKIKSIEELKELAKNNFQVLKPCKNRKGKATVKISINSYAELSYFLIDVLKVTVAALEADSEGVGTVRNVPNAVSGVLEKIIEIIPLEEMDLLDKIHELVVDDYKRG
ncbi:hypothetical protein [Flavobacterium sp. UBA7682]|uniref:hypothetical protein n=1 Tax=Flavobacterium sp. UBA7682 TaxID=1946560 RepID=UPI0025BF060F|nr:hypothetical protein [Flavobacterium sp. UBA7682]